MGCDAMTWGEGLNSDGLRCPPLPALELHLVGWMGAGDGGRERSNRTAIPTRCETNVSIIPLCSHSCWQLTCELSKLFSSRSLALRCDKRLYASLAGFEGCVTQGCDEESFETAKDLALSHPLQLGLCVCLGVMEWWNQDSSWFGFLLYFVSFVFLFTEILRYCRLEKYRLTMLIET